MINKKLGISIPWLARTTNLNLISQENIRNIIKNIFLKQNIFISDIYIQEYPKLIFIYLNCLPITTKQYKLFLNLIKIINSLLNILYKKNIYVSFKISSNLYADISILSDWLSLKLYNQPSNIKKLLKQTIRQYDTIIK